MRKRKHQVKIWMNDEEHAVLKQKIKESGLNQQTIILNAIAGHKTTSAEEVADFFNIFFCAIPISLIQ